MKEQYKLAIGTAATAQDALAMLDQQTQEFYAQGYVGMHRARIYQSRLGGLHVAYKELVRYEPDYEPKADGVYFFTKTQTGATA